MRVVSWLNTVLGFALPQCFGGWGCRYTMPHCFVVDHLVGSAHSPSLCAPDVYYPPSRAQQNKISSPRVILSALPASSWSNHFAGIKSGRPILRRIFRRCTKQRDSTIAGFGLYRIDVDRCSIKLAELQCRTMSKEYIGVYYTSRKDMVEKKKKNGRERIDL